MKTIMKTMAVALVAISLSLTTRASAAHYNMVPMVRTPIDRVSIASVLRAAHAIVFGSDPSDNRLAAAWGQIALENGHGQYVWNHNLGNTTPWADGQPAFYNPGDRNTYRSYTTFVDSAQTYWITLRRCVRALTAFDNGQMITAAQQLKNCNYYDAPVAAYANLMRDLYSYAKREVLPKEHDERAFKQDIQRLLPGPANPG